MAKTMKCMDICVEGKRFVCTFTPTDRNPYRLYKQWYDRGWHKKLLEKYANFFSVIEWLKCYSLETKWGFKDCCFEKESAS